MFNRNGERIQMIKETEINTQPASIPKPKKKKLKSKFWILLGLSIFVISILLYIAVIEDNKFEEGACEGAIFLGHCFDMESEYFTCDVEKEDCNSKNWETIFKIKLFEEADVVIYGREGCIWCERQLEEFGAYADYLITSGLYVDCTVTPINECSDITVTPTWKEKGQIVYEGYLPLSDIRIETG